MTGVEVPAAAWLVALSGLGGMGPARLSALLDRWEPEEAWCQVMAGTLRGDHQVVTSARGLGVDLVARWRREARATDVVARWSAHVDAGVGVVARGGRCYPVVLLSDPEPPPVLFHRGELGALDHPRVAIVGTRRCTHAGRVTARALGHDLAAAGVCVVSGLASGIDGEAHHGALEASLSGGAAPVAVVGTGLDVVYPKGNAVLWEGVATRGAVVSEYPLGTGPQAWRFPARNRIIAALADVVVVVESHARGGSLHTVDAAIERDRPVMAVPGPVRSPASAGTNDLLVAGAGPARDAGDILSALGLDVSARARGQGRGRAAPGAVEQGLALTLLEAMGWEPATIEDLAARVDASLPEVAVELSRLERDGRLLRQGSWLRQREGPSADDR